MPDPGAKSGAVSFVTQSSGLDNYVVFKPEAGQLRLDQAFTDGTVIKYMVTNGADISIERGTVTLPDTLTRTEFIISNTGSPISWPETGQRTVWPISPGLPLCDTEPTDGQVLIWDEAEQNWCPGDITAVDEDDDDTADMQNVDSGTTYGVTLTKFDTQVIWNSTDPGDKTTTIPATSDDNNGFSLDIKFSADDGTTHCVEAPSGTIGGVSGGIQVQDNNCNLSMRSNHAKNDWLIRQYSCFTPTPCEAPPGPQPSAVFVPSTPSPTGVVSYLSRGGPLSGVPDNSEGTLSLWLNTLGGVGNSSSLLTVDFDLEIKLLPWLSGIRVQFFHVSMSSVITDFDIWFNPFLPALTSGSWDHYLLAWSMNHAIGSRAVKLYINDDAQVGTVITDSGGSPGLIVGYTSAQDTQIFGRVHQSPGAIGSHSMIGGAYDYWFDPTYLDPILDANRRKFLTAGLEAADLGPNGEAPLGVPPAVFQHMDSGTGAPSDFYVNRGYGGGFTLTGTDFTTTPSAPPLE